MAQIRFLTSLMLILCVACVPLRSTDSASWQSTLYTEHDLVGMIWDVRADRFVSEDELLAEAKGVSYLLLGEKHDNPDHHALQLKVLNAVLELDAVSNVSFEMMNSDQQPLLQELSTLRELRLDEIKEHLKWDNEGWNWQFYGPLVQSALERGASINAANISNAKMMQVYSEPTAAEIEGVLDAATVAALEKDIDESHCGMLPESQFPAMVRVQQARDFAMAKSLSESIGGQVLIAGNYHIRRDLGVPNYIRHARPDLDERDILSLALIEVDQSSARPQDYIDQSGAQMSYDYIWFTPAVSDEDYCASLGQQ